MDATDQPKQIGNKGQKENIAKLFYQIKHFEKKVLLR